MYAVIFRAKINQLDEEYSATAARMRELAIEKYGCTEFVATTEGNSEIAISYWESLEAIKEWKADSEHLVAQKLGQEKWYQSYHVQITEIVSEYKNA